MYIRTKTQLESMLDAQSKRNVNKDNGGFTVKGFSWWSPIFAFCKKQKIVAIKIRYWRKKYNGKLLKVCNNYSVISFTL